VDRPKHFSPVFREHDDSIGELHPGGVGDARSAVRDDLQVGTFCTSSSRASTALRVGRRPFRLALRGGRRGEHMARLSAAWAGHGLSTGARAPVPRPLVRVTVFPFGIPDRPTCHGFHCPYLSRGDFLERP
jgi:hypothetical protein